MSVDQIKAIASSRLGFARSNQYLVELPSLSGGGGGLGGLLSSFVPSIPGVVGAGVASTNELNILCKNATLPGKQITTVDRRIGMTFEKIAYGYAVDDVNMTFYVMNDYGVRNYFDEWRKKIVDEETFQVSYKSEYSYPVKIHQLRRPQVGVNANVGPVSVNIGFGSGSVYSVELLDAFPTTFSAIDLSNDLDGLVEMTVSLSYTNWKVIKPSQNFINVGIGI